MARRVGEVFFFCREIGHLDDVHIQGFVLNDRASIAIHRHHSALLAAQRDRCLDDAGIFERKQRDLLGDLFPFFHIKAKKWRSIGKEDALFFGEVAAFSLISTWRLWT